MDNATKLIIFARCLAYAKRATYWQDIDQDKYKFFMHKFYAIKSLIDDLGLTEEYNQATK